MVAEKKKQFVQQLTEQIKSHSVLALVNMQHLPAQQLQNMRYTLRQKGIILTMARKKLLQLALKNSQKKNVEQLIEKIKGMPALLLAKENPFTLYAILQKSKSAAPAKPNQEAPTDIVVPAGKTNFAPGPIISELANVGIKTKVDGGKLAILENTTVAKEGETISSKLAEMLKRLDIKPMEVGLDLVAALEEGKIFDAKQLHIDEAEYLNNITTAFQEALNLSVELALPTTDNIELLLQKAFQESRSLSLDQDILTDLTTEEILAKTEQQALSLKDSAKIEVSDKKPESKPKPELPEQKVEEKPEVPKEEEKTAEAPVDEKKEETTTETEEVVEEKPVEEAPKEEKPEEESIEEPAEEETNEEGEAEETSEEESSEEQPQEEVKEQPSPESKKEVPTEEKEPSSEELLEQAQKKAAELNQKEKKEQDIAATEKIVKETMGKFSENKQPEQKPTEKISAEELVQEEKQKAVQEPKPDTSIKDAENLFEKLKKQGTLRGEE